MAPYGDQWRVAVRTLWPHLSDQLDAATVRASKFLGASAGADFTNSKTIPLHGFAHIPLFGFAHEFRRPQNILSYEALESQCNAQQLLTSLDVKLPPSRARLRFNVACLYRLARLRSVTKVLHMWDHHLLSRRADQYQRMQIQRRTARHDALFL